MKLVKIVILALVVVGTMMPDLAEAGHRRKRKGCKSCGSSCSAPACTTNGGCSS